MRFNRASDFTGRGLVMTALALASIVVMPPEVALAQSNNGAPRVIAEGSLGAATYWDNFQVYGTVFGGSARFHVSPRIAVGPEISSVAPTESFTSSQLLVLAVGSIDLHRRLSAPFVTIGGGTMHRYSSQPPAADSNTGVFVAGFGWRVASKSASRGWYVAPEFRAVIFDDVAWHPRVNVGYRF